ncbi:MAG: kstR 3 [Conexibacter sp.]|nr:kstR 3 [Conexibacter sp.]
MSDPNLPRAPDPAGWRAQRSTAARNEAAILEAAERLLRAKGPEGADVHEIAAAASVGVGTVYRRFGNKASLIAAVAGEQERELQDAMLDGPPPLGPGAPPRERLEAFLRTLCRHIESYLDALVAGDAAAPRGRHGSGAYNAWRLHAAVLLRDIGTGGDPEWTADLLLGAVQPLLYRHQRRERGLSAAGIEDELVAAARRLTAGTAPPAV